MSRVVHFEIHAADAERAATFYREVFGWQVTEWAVPGGAVQEEDRYWLVATGNEDEAGINGGIILRRGPAPSEGQPVNAYVCTVEVDDIDDSLAKVVQAGGAVAVPKVAVTGVGWSAYCRDTDGNLFGLMQSDADAE